ncbi:TPA: tolA family protein [Citrobacter koseri]|nr:tolA family protein [Citrobacter koseri]
MIKFLMLIVVTLTIAGCSPLAPTGCQKKNAMESCEYKSSGKVSDKDIYGWYSSRIKKALDAALTEPHAWNGKRCDAHLDFKVDGTLQNFIVKGGDKDYCAALQKASERATFPAFTDRRVYFNMSSARWNFEGQP